jgi:hypothetical protein
MATMLTVTGTASVTSNRRRHDGRGGQPIGNDGSKRDNGSKSGRRGDRHGGKRKEKVYNYDLFYMASSLLSSPSSRSQSE